MHRGREHLQVQQAPVAEHQAVVLAAEHLARERVQLVEPGLHGAAGLHLGHHTHDRWHGAAVLEDARGTRLEHVRHTHLRLRRALAEAKAQDAALPHELAALERLVDPVELTPGGRGDHHLAEAKVVVV